MIEMDLKKFSLAGLSRICRNDIHDPANSGEGP